MRIIAEKEGVPTVKVINQRSRTHAARREREKSQVLGTPINAMVVIIVGLQGQPAEGFALVQQPQGQDERKAKAGTMRQDVVEAHGMAQITLDLERRGPALRRGDKGDQETTKKRRRQSRRRRPGGSGSWGEGGIGVPACAWVHLYGGATRRAGESWLAPIWRSRQGFFFFPLPVGAGAPIWGSHSQELGSSTAYSKVVVNNSPTMPRNISGMSVQFAPSVKTVMIAGYIVLRNALSSNRFVESFRYFLTTGRHFQCRPRLTRFGPNRRWMISFYAFYITFHSYRWIDWRMTTFTLYLHLRMDHVNGKNILIPASAPLQLLKCLEMEVAQ